MHTDSQLCQCVARPQQLNTFNAARLPAKRAAARAQIWGARARRHARLLVGSL